MDPPVHADFRSLHRIKLVVNGRSRTGQIENFIGLDVERETNVMAHQLEASIRQQMMHVASGPGVEIINAQNFVAAFQQAIAKVRSNKSGSAGDEDTTFSQHGQALREKQAASRANLVSIIRLGLVPNL